MKKVLQLIIICILFIPLLVNAETCDNDKVSISSITMEDKSDNVEELNEATSSNKNINIDLNMSNVGDNIKYRIVIKNDSSNDYLLNKNSIKVSSNYIDYNIESSDNTNIVKGKTAKAFYLNILYKNQVPDNLFSNGPIDDNVTMKLNLSSDNIQNPNTGMGIMYFAFIAFVITVMIVMSFAFKKKRKTNRFEFLIIGLALLIPIGVKALCSVDLNINSKIKIDRPIVCGSFETDSWDVISHNVKNGNDSCYNVGDTKEVELEGFGTHTVRIANKSTPDECNQDDFSQTACGFVVEFADIIITHRMNRNQSVGEGNEGGWPASEMRTYVNSDIYNALPSNLKSIINNTTVVSSHGSSDSANFTSTDKLYLLSTHEVYEDVDGYLEAGSSDTAYNNTRQLDYYKSFNVTTSNIYRAIKQISGRTEAWWLRSTTDDDPIDFFLIYDNDTFAANWYYTDADIPLGVSPAFRIG